VFLFIGKGAFIDDLGELNDFVSSRAVLEVENFKSSSILNLE
jgi:hypothetical protein